MSQALTSISLITLACATSCSHVGARSRRSAPSSSAPPRLTSWSSRLRSEFSRSANEVRPRASSISVSVTGQSIEVLPEKLRVPQHDAGENVSPQQETGWRTWAELIAYETGMVTTTTLTLRLIL